METLAFRRGSSVQRPYLVLIHTSAAPDPKEWRAYVAALDRTLAEAHGRVHIFVATDGGGPNDAQRRELAAVMLRDSRDALTHVFSTSALVRAIVTAFRWIAPPRAVAYHPKEFATLCEKLGYAPLGVLKDFEQVQDGFPPVSILAQMASTVQR